MFAGGLREMQQNEIRIQGVTYTAMNKLLDFIYTSELELDLETVQEVLCAATLMQVKITRSSLVDLSVDQVPASVTHTFLLIVMSQCEFILDFSALCCPGQALDRSTILSHSRNM